MTTTGRAWVFGDDVNTDLIAPARYLKGPASAFAPHSMETVRAEFAGEVRPGDVVVAGKNFGCGSSREQAPEALRHLGVAAVIAKSFARTFYRNAMNLGLPAVVCRAAEAIPDGARLRLSIDQGVIEDLDSGRRYDCDAIPPHLMSMLNDGGLLGHLKRRLQAGELSESAR